MTEYQSYEKTKLSCKISDISDGELSTKWSIDNISMSAKKDVNANSDHKIQRKRTSCISASLAQSNFESSICSNEMNECESPFERQKARDLELKKIDSSPINDGISSIRWKRLPGIKLRTLSPSKNNNIASNKTSVRGSIQSPRGNSTNISQVDNKEGEEEEEEPYHKMVDLLGLIGINFSANKPKNFLQDNVNRMMKKEKPKKRVPYQYDYGKYESILLKMMNKIEYSIDGFYGDWNRDEFKNTRSIHKLRNYQNLSPNKLYSKIFPNIPDDFLRYKIEVEPKGIKNNYEPILEKFKFAMKKTSKKPDPKDKYKRMSVDEFAQLGKGTIPEDPNDKKRHEEWLRKLSVQRQKREKLLKQGECLQFPIINLGKQKYGGIIKDSLLLDKQTAKDIIESLKVKDNSSDDEGNYGIGSSSDNHNKDNTKSMNDTNDKQKMKFNKILSYFNSNDSGILSNKIPGTPNQKDSKMVKFIQTYDVINSKRGYSEYQSPSSPIMNNHNELENKNTNSLSKKKYKDDIILPIIKNIDDISFILIGYSLNQKMSMLLGQTLISKKKLLQHIIMVNNELTDDSAEIFFNQIKDHLPHVIIFRYVKNHIGPKTAKLIQNGFFTNGYNNLKELTLDSCKISDDDLSVLLQKAYLNTTRIKYLSLANVSLKNQSITTLIKFIFENDSLLYLDISWNKLHHQCITQLIDACYSNQNLKYVNFSYNHVSYSPASSNLPNLEENKLNEEDTIQSILSNKSSIIQENSSSDKSEPVVNKISRSIELLRSFIITHSNLIHLNLSNTKLNDIEIKHIAEGMSYSCSLMSMHFTGNFITFAGLKDISEILKAKRGSMDDYNITNPNENTLKFKIYESRQMGQFDYEENQHIKNWEHEPHVDTNETAQILQDDSKRIVPFPVIYYRIIDPDINMHYQSWICSQHCWICDQWQKIVIKFGLDSENFVKVSQDGQRPSKLLSTDSTKIKSDVAIEENPNLNSRAKNKTPITLEANENQAITDSLLLPPNSTENQAKDSNLSPKSLKKTPKRNFIRVLRPELKFWICGTFTCGNWYPIELEPNTMNLRYCDYIPHGVHKYQIKKSNVLTNESTILYETETLVKLRDKEIQAYRVNVPGNDYICKKKFELNRSVFKSFRSDSEVLYNRCLETDWKYIKITKFINKPEEILLIKQSIMDNYAKLKGIFLFRSSKSKVYPFVDWPILLQTAQDLNVIDDNVGIPEVERAYLSSCIANGELEANEMMNGNSRKELTRHGFIEFLIRLAILKYYDKENNTTNEAWETFYYGHVRKLKSSEIFYDFYRSTTIHTIRIDQLFKHNLDSCEKLFNKYRLDLAKGLEFKIVQTILQNAKITLKEEDFIYLAAHSKMTVINELRDCNIFIYILNHNMNAISGYDRRCFTFVEFLDFIVRLADFIYKKENYELHHKVEDILKKLFSLINETVILLVNTNNEFED